MCDSNIWGGQRHPHPVTCDPSWAAMTARCVIIMSASSWEEARSSLGSICPSEVVVGMGSCPVNINCWCCVAWAKYIDPPRYPQKWACSVVSCFWSLIRHDHGVGVERLYSVDVPLNKYFCPSGLRYWCSSRSTRRKSGEHRGLLVLRPYNISHELLNIATNRSVYGPKHSWAINDCDIWLDGSRWYLNLKGFLQCSVWFSQSHVPCRMKYWWWICRQFTGHYGIEDQ